MLNEIYCGIADGFSIVTRVVGIHQGKQMMSTKTDSDELSRWFAEFVVESFRFLKLNGYRSVDSSKDSIRFTSPKLTVEVYRDVRSNEISLQIANPTGTQSFSICELVRLFDGTESARSYRDCAAHTRDGIKEGVYQLALRFQSLIDSPEWSNGDLFARLEVSGKAWAIEYGLETQLEQVRKKLHVAWHAKDYRSVVMLLEPFVSHLSDSETMKLEYAKGH